MFQAPKTPIRTEVSYGSIKLDLLVGDRLIVELKAVETRSNSFSPNDLLPTDDKPHAWFIDQFQCASAEGRDKASSRVITLGVLGVLAA